MCLAILHKMSAVIIVLSFILLQIYSTVFQPLSFWQNSAKMTKLKIGTKPKQSFQTTKNKKLNFFTCKINCFVALTAKPNSF